MNQTDLSALNHVLVTSPNRRLTTTYQSTKIILDKGMAGTDERLFLRIDEKLEASDWIDDLNALAIKLGIDLRSIPLDYWEEG